FLSNLRSVRNTIGAIDSKLGKLRAERVPLAVLPPDLGAIRAWVLRGIDAACESYVARLRRWHWNEEQLAKFPGEVLDAHAGARNGMPSPERKAKLAKLDK